MATGATSWNTCNVYGTWHNQDGTNREGSYTATIPARVCNATDDVIIPAGVFATGALNVTLGQKSLDLEAPANDDPDNTPVDWGRLKLEIKFKDAAAETYIIDTPVGGSVNLRTVLLPSSTPSQAPFLVLGVPGGAAQLSADGESVLNADGNPISTGGGGVTSYDSLTDKPTLGTAAAQNVSAFATAAQGAKADTALQSAALSGYATTAALTSGLAGKATTAQGSKADSAVQPGSLANVATSGSASDLTTGTLPTSVLPPLAINETTVVASQAAMLALTAQRGDMAIRTDNGKTYVLSTDAPATLADWKEVLAAGQVASVAGKTGVVSLAKGDVGLSSVDNTSDAAKPISTATQAALNGKASTAGLVDYAKTADVLPATIGSTATSNVVVVAHGATAPTGLPDGTVIVELSA